MAREGSIICGDSRINYIIEKGARRSMAITVNRDGVVVKLPPYVTYEQGEEFLHSKVDWIAKHMAKIERRDQLSPKTTYCDGETLLYLGRKHILKVDIRAEEGVDRISDNIVVYASSEDRVEPLLKWWYLNKAAKIILPIAEKASHIFCENEGVQLPRLEVKYARRYWGICSSKGIIRFNVELMRLDVELIEYVIIHELCHLIHHNHSPRFYDLLSCYMPDCQDRRKRLRSDYTISM